MTVKKFFFPCSRSLIDSWLHPLTAAYQRHGFSHMLWVTCMLVFPLFVGSLLKVIIAHISQNTFLNIMQCVT